LDPELQGRDNNEPVMLIPSDVESLPCSEISTPAKSDASTFSSGSGCSSNGSVDEMSDFERFRGPYLSTRELLHDIDDERPASAEMGALSDVSSQPEHLEHPSVDECWIVTPPPCFLGAGRGEIATSPLENLLIEHPSMSVYQPTHIRAPRRPGRPSQPPANELQPLSLVNVAAAAGAMLPPRVIPSPGPVVNHARQLQHHIPPAATRWHNPSTWRAVNARSLHENSRRSIDRHNHIVASSANNRRRQRRAVRNSGMNNDRHCQ
jgi:DOR family